MKDTIKEEPSFLERILNNKNHGDYQVNEGGFSTKILRSRNEQVTGRTCGIGWSKDSPWSRNGWSADWTRHY
ncbi:MAG: hypothetical protein QWI36_01980 [Wolbachia endosymbiont of Tyrophagus putrescentiae]|nr:hypothetical protein [Wolbachia endosymbiont of Tyrophagus putrescentiae]